MLRAPSHFITLERTGGDKNGEHNVPFRLCAPIPPKERCSRPRSRSATKGGYDVVPANIMLAGAEQELSQTGKEHRLKEAVAPVAADYDFVVIDTPPSLGVLTVNAITCATDILIPTTAGIFATAGISQLNETVTSVQKYCNPAVKVRGILFTRFNPRANISRQMKELAEQLGEYISAPIYKTYIRSAVVVEEAQANSQDIFDYANKSTVAEDYKAFIDEFLKGVNE